MSIRSALRDSKGPATTVISVLLESLLKLIAFANLARAVIVAGLQLFRPGIEFALPTYVMAKRQGGGVIPEGVTVVPPGGFHGSVDVLIDSLSIGPRMLLQLGPTVASLGWALGTWSLARALSSISVGHLFAPRVPRYLYLLGAAMIAGPIFSGIASTWAIHVVLGRPAYEAVLTNYGSPSYGNAIVPRLTIVIIGLIVLVIAEAFRQGRRMSAELEGLV